MAILSRPPATHYLLQVLLLALGASVMLALPSEATADAICGNGVVEAGEDCDDGGTCLGGSDAGTHCTAESDCVSDGVCIGGFDVGKACAVDAACPGGVCRRCVPQGGDGCAANCTAERDIPYSFTIDAEVQSSTLGTFPVPLGGALKLTIGKPVLGMYPVVIKAQSVAMPPTDVSGLACVCMRAVALKTCGGTWLEPDGITPSADCTQDPGVCNGCPPCAFVYGEGNAAAGVLACVPLLGVDLTVVQDAAGPGTPPLIELSGVGEPGSALILLGTATAELLGSCAAQGPGVCTTAPYDTPVTLPFASGTATAEVLNVNPETGESFGPFSVTGSLLDCGLLSGGDVAPDLTLASAQTMVSAAPVPCTDVACGIDAIVSTYVLAAQPLSEATPTATPAPPTPTPTGPLPTALPSCIGDCNGDGQVTVDELLTGVSMALGTVPLSACPAFGCSPGCGPGPGIHLPDVACILRAVDDALNGCPPVPCTSDQDCDDTNPCSRDQCTPSGCVHYCGCF